MNDLRPAAPPLTEEQRAVVEQPWDARLLVSAGAGSGKTHTVVRRLDHLVGGDDPEESLEAGEILVLSFSRAAVRDLTERIARHGERANRVRARTFDAWALDLLLRTYPDTDWHAESFDARIEAAVKAVEAGALDATEEGPPTHVVIDEAQDLVGERRNLVETVLDKYQDELGFTVVGDAAQGIYGFQVEPDLREQENGWFFDWLRSSYPDDLNELSLTANFRARTTEARVALSLTTRVQRLGTDDAEAERLFQALSDRLADLPGFTSLDDEVLLMAVRDNPTPTAILSRDNRQALMVSERLRDHGVPHILKRKLEDRSAPGWIADLLARTDASTLAKKRFDTLFSELDPPAGIDSEEAWPVLLRYARAGSGRAEQIDVVRVRELIATRRFPEELAPLDTAPLTVSTVHRAKGLEYDRVILLDPPAWSELPKRVKDEVDPVAEVRGLYVAMTRARDDLLHVPGPEIRQLRTQRPSGRSYLGGFKYWERYGLQLRGRDVRRDVPPGHGADADPAKVQEYLREAVRPGDPVTLVAPLALTEGDRQSPRYLIVHGDEERVVGEVSETFRCELYAVLKVSATWEIRDWPERIEGGHVDCVEAVAGAASVAADVGVTGNGVWSAVRLAGLARFARAENDEEQT
ncbi:UvrD-helicase domain-containing protein [Streptomyces iconiensis]|uniref:DNA 3'-5' helicase n=1 Tax=Streptomyces iconiensis TaxID=1384038 RepID=A0ABT6ZZM3_9ACTN|nr:UvrD-helicase domain-containing protein [Streptomyces iconiensis]MDJ1134506.1 UvrD-helicase domain-containing protein [Streptomyces iconiensis]